MTATASLDSETGSAADAVGDNALSTAPRDAARGRGRILRGTLAIAVLALALALALVARALRPLPELPVFGHVPNFRLVDELDRPFTSDSMLGHVTVVDFIFTKCTSSCPRLTAAMAELQSRLAHAKSGARLVSFSVDPDNDTPSVLTDYSARAHADAGRWSFVTGSADDVERAVVLGFKISAVKLARGARDYDVIHGDWFVLVDHRGDVRGYYPSDEAKDLDKVMTDVQRLERTASR